MRPIARFELAAEKENELQGLHRYAFKELDKIEAESYQRRKALASYENNQDGQVLRKQFFYR